MTRPRTRPFGLSVLEPYLAAILVSVQRFVESKVWQLRYQMAHIAGIQRTLDAEIYRLSLHAQETDALIDREALERAVHGLANERLQLRADRRALEAAHQAASADLARLHHSYSVSLKHLTEQYDERIEREARALPVGFVNRLWWLLGR